ncbi:MAG: sel1 repeat family protein [Planctomycetes bacterium]|nr:sel1 repeat family protein [Planctomycetota bacterium]
MRKRSSLIFIGIALVIGWVIFAYYHATVPYTYEVKTCKTPSRNEFLEIQNLANAQDADALLIMGILYANGIRVPQDYQKAAEYYLSSAEKGNAIAQRNLGLLYDCGVGVPQDYAKAAKWYRLADYNDDPAATFALGGFPYAFREQIFPRHLGSYNFWRLKAIFSTFGPQLEDRMEQSFWQSYYSSEEYVQNDMEIVNQVYRRAMNGDGEAQLRMSLFYLQGQCVEKKAHEVNKWLRKSAENGNIRARFILSRYSHDDAQYCIEPLGNDAVIKAWKKEAADSRVESYFTFSHSDEDDHALLRVGYMPAIKKYWRRPEIFTDGTILTHIIKAADDGDPEAMAFLVWSNLVGYGGPKNFDLARKYFEHLIKSYDRQAVGILLEFMDSMSPAQSARLGEFIINTQHKDDYCKLLKNILVGYKGASILPAQKRKIEDVRQAAAYYYSGEYYRKVLPLWKFPNTRYIANLCYKRGAIFDDYPSAFEYMEREKLSRYHELFIFLILRKTYVMSSTSFPNMEQVLITTLHKKMQGGNPDSLLSPVIGYRETQ